MIVSIYCDGGVIAKNPSKIGGTWAFCHVDDKGERVFGNGGVIAWRECSWWPDGVSNNVSEMFAMVMALKSLPDGWTGDVYTDSLITMGRTQTVLHEKPWAMKGLSPKLIERLAAQRERLGELSFTLLQGHPTKADLTCGTGKKRGFPVSEHNVWCDHECGRQAAGFIRLGEADA